MARFQCQLGGYGQVFAVRSGGFFNANIRYANNFLLLYLGWEGVGLCSFLLIGFWYREPQNVRAASKAFIVTRCGDTAFALGLFLLFTRLGTLDIQQVMHRAAAQWDRPAGPLEACPEEVRGRWGSGATEAARS